MIVGLYHALQPFASITARRVKALVQEGERLGLELIFFSADGIHAEEQRIHGQMFRNNQWMELSRPYPAVVLNRNPFQLRLWSEQEKHLRRHTPFINHKYGGKMRVTRKLSAYPHLAPYMIPTAFARHIEELDQWLERYGKLVIKPNRGTLGQGVRALFKDQGHYILQAGGSTQAMEHGRLAREVLAWAEQRHLVQPYIQCLTPEGEPYDFRVLVHRCEGSSWEVTGIYPKIGRAGSVASNLAGGGRTEELLPFVRRLFPDVWERIPGLLGNLGLEIARTVSQGRTQCEFGIDLAVDANRRIWFYEANCSPQTRSLERERAAKVLTYARYAARCDPPRPAASVGLLVSRIPPVPVMNAYAAEALRRGITLFATTPDRLQSGEALIPSRRLDGDTWVDNHAACPGVWLDRRPLQERISAPFTGAANSSLCGLRLSAVYRQAARYPELNQAVPAHDPSLHIESVHRLLMEHGWAVLRPDSIAAGPAHSLLIRPSGGKYVLLEGDRRHIVSRPELAALLELLAGKGFLAVQGVDAVDAQHVPYRLQVVVMADGSGSWTVAAIVPVYPIPGSSSNEADKAWVPRDWRTLLRDEWGETPGAAFHRRLQQVCLLLAEQLADKTALTELTVEIAVDHTRNCWICGIMPAVPEALLELDEVARISIAFALSKHPMP